MITLCTRWPFLVFAMIANSTQFDCMIFIHGIARTELQDITCTFFAGVPISERIPEMEFTEVISGLER